MDKRYLLLASVTTNGSRFEHKLQAVDHRGQKRWHEGYEDTYELALKALVGNVKSLLRDTLPVSEGGDHA